MILRFRCCRINGKCVVPVLCLTFFPYDDSVVMSITGTLEEILTNVDVSKHFRKLITEGVKYVRVKS